MYPASVPLLNPQTQQPIIVDGRNIMLTPQLDAMGNQPLRDPQTNEPIMYASGLPLLNPTTGQYLQMDNRPVIMYPMLDPAGNLYYDQKGKPLMELPIEDE
jgi:hypothetical protein